MMQLFDTHAHLDSAQLVPILDEVIENARSSGLVGIVAVGTTVTSSSNCLDLAEKYDFVWASVGIHPNHCAESSESDWEQIQKLVEHPKAVAIGETGLDRHWDYCPFEVQQRWFKRHIQLSCDTGKPLVIHMRDCEQDILDALQPFASRQPVNGIMHSFTGTETTVRQCLEWGMHISFAGMVTFKKSTELREIAAMIPDERLLIETDSPYLSPHPHRGQRPNQPYLVKHTAECLATVRGVSVEALAGLTTRNAQRLFGMSENQLASRPRNRADRQA
jgi:TatD DNase family protein